MAEHRDAEIAEVVVVLDQSCERDLPATLQRLTEIGLEVIQTDDQSLTIDGTVDASKVAALQKLECVKYVRVSMTYIADYPPGDPRDKDGEEAED
jgi:hypothetical protein